jgi:membrane associated rhomboid family serine protease
MQVKKHPFGSTLESLIYPLLLVAILWIIQWADTLSPVDFYKWGLLPRSAEGLKGILFMPLLHSERDIHHLLNNSVAFYLLLAVLIYFYRDVALKVFLLLWVMTGALVWVYAKNTGSYHIGMSGVIYGLLGFLFTSGVLRRYLPLQAISLFIVFMYGNMIWGIFPIRASVSWEGHFMGLVAGVILAFVYRKEAVQAPKYQYEIEKEMGIEPPDLEGQWIARQLELRRLEEERQRREAGYYIVYHYIPNEPETTSEENLSTDENEPKQ